MKHPSTLWIYIGFMIINALFNTSNAATPNSEKLTPSIRAITQAVSAGHENDLMQAALTNQLFKESSPFKPRWNAAGQVQVYIHFDRASTLPDTDALASLGATSMHVTTVLGVVQAWVPATNLSAIAALPWVTLISTPHYLLTNGMAPMPAQTRGTIDAQADSVMGTSAFRSATGKDGTGITVGVINIGNAGLSQSQSAGDLPSGIYVDPNYPGNGTDGEGTAMMELVHALAPGAGLAFCGPATDADFVNCLDDLYTNAHAQIIVDDITFPATAYFTNDSDVVAVQQWQTNHASVRLVTAAGNFATSFWSGTWKPVAITPYTLNGVTYTEAQNFGTSTNPVIYDTITVEPDDTFEWILEWDDPWIPTADLTNNSPDDPNDYDVVLANSNGTVISCDQGQTSDNTGCNQPGAAASATPGPEPGIGNTWTNTSGSAVNVYLYIFQRAGTPGNQLKLFAGSVNSCGVLLNPVTASDSIIGHATLPYPAEISVGAINASDAVNGQNTVEYFSSQGPVLLPLLTSTAIQKPDFAALDGVAISGSGGFPPAVCGSGQPPPVYYGTSAAAPQVAAQIALLESAGYTSDQVYGILQQNATTVGSGSPNYVAGYGLANIANVKAAGSGGGGGSSGGSSSGGGGGGLGFLSLGVLVIGVRNKWRKKLSLT